jgi:hypothetical protein
LAAVKSYLFSGKKLVITVEDGLGGADFDANRFIKGLEKWKEKLAGRNDKMKGLLDNLIILGAFKDEADLRAKLGKETAIDVNNKKDNFIFVFAKNSKDKASGISGIGEAVRAVMVEEPNGMDGCYYPLVEIVTLSLLKELLNIDTETMMKMLKESKVDIEGLNIQKITEDATNVAYLIFSVIPKIRRYDSNEVGDRYAKLLKFVQSA